MEFATTDLIKVTLDVSTNLILFYLTQPFKTLENNQELRKQARIGKGRNVHNNLSKQLLWHVIKVFILCQCAQQVSAQKTLKGKNYYFFDNVITITFYVISLTQKTITFKVHWML